jgi:hypothetical protein
MYEWVLIDYDVYLVNGLDDFYQRSPSKLCLKVPKSHIRKFLGSFR